MKFDNCNFDQDEWLLKIAKTARDLTPENREIFKDEIKRMDSRDKRNLVK